MMSNLAKSKDTALTHCKCDLCHHSDRIECISGRCYCCDLEDAFSLLTLHEFEPPQSQLVTRENMGKKVIAWQSSDHADVLQEHAA